MPFEFIFEEWLNVQLRLSSKRVGGPSAGVARHLPAPDQHPGSVPAPSPAHRAALLRDEPERGGGAAVHPRGHGAGDLPLGLHHRGLSPPRGPGALPLVSPGTPGAPDPGGALSAAPLLRALHPQPGGCPAASPRVRVAAQLRVEPVGIREGRFTEAAAHCREVLQFTPHYLFQAAAYNDLAYCMVESQESLNLALLYAEKARELVPRLFDAHVADTMAWLNYRQGNLEEALSRIEEVIQAGRNPVSPLVATSVHYFHYGRSSARWDARRRRTRCSPWRWRWRSTQIPTGEWPDAWRPRVDATTPEGGIAVRFGAWGVATGAGLCPGVAVVRSDGGPAASRSAAGRGHGDLDGKGRVTQASGPVGSHRPPWPAASPRSPMRAVRSALTGCLRETTRSRSRAGGTSPPVARCTSRRGRRAASWWGSRATAPARARDPPSAPTSPSRPMP